MEWTITGEPFEACVRPGQTLTFEWEGPYHNVERVDFDGYENCDGFKNTEGVEGPYVFKAKREGKYYFVCGVSQISIIMQWGETLYLLQVGGHCAQGNQKATVTVSRNC